MLTPEDHMGDVIGDLNSRRGMVEGFDDRPGGMKLVKSQVPLSAMFNYVSNLRSMTKGRGSYAMKLSTPPLSLISLPAGVSLSTVLAC